ncbi:MAG: hypothetical protein Q9206_004483 [Seirophora lacunosa]
MTLPLDCSHAHLSVSGPNQRGIFLKRPELLKAEVALEAEALRWWREEVRKGVVRPGRVTSGGSSSETGEGDDVDILMAGEMLYAILYASSLGMTRIVIDRTPADEDYQPSTECDQTGFEPSIWKLYWVRLCGFDVFVDFLGIGVVVAGSVGICGGDATRTVLLISRAFVGFVSAGCHLALDTRM